MLKVEELRKNAEMLQNEFIAVCSDLVKHHVLGERQSVKYYAIIVDSIPNSSHAEQTTFHLR